MTPRCGKQSQGRPLNLNFMPFQVEWPRASPGARPGSAGRCAQPSALPVRLLRVLPSAGLRVSFRPLPGVLTWMCLCCLLTKQLHCKGNFQSKSNSEQTWWGRGEYSFPSSTAVCPGTLSVAAGCVVVA